MHDSKPVAWHSNPDLKTSVVERMKAHHAADSIIQGTYQQRGFDTPLGYQGCLIGCTLPHNAVMVGWHREVEDRYGIPVVIAYLADATFEYLPASECPDFALAFCEAIPVGVDLSTVAPNLLHDIVTLRPGRLAVDLPDRVEIAITRTAQLFTDGAPAGQWDELKRSHHIDYAEADHAEYHALDLLWWIADAMAEIQRGDAGLDGYPAAATAINRVNAAGWCAERLIHRLATAPVPLGVSS